MDTAKRGFWLPTRGYNVIAGINRVSAATGSLRGAFAATGADYNGHMVSFVEPNPFKRNWTCYYFWAGIHTIGRGSLTDCLKAAKAEYDRGALGASAEVWVTTDADAQACLDAGFEPYSKEIEIAHSRTWRTPLHDLIPEAFSLEKHGLFPGAVGTLANCKTAEEFKEKYESHKKSIRRR